MAVRFRKVSAMFRESSACITAENTAIIGGKAKDKRRNLVFYGAPGRTRPVKSFNSLAHVAVIRGVVSPSIRAAIPRQRNAALSMNESELRYA